MFKKFLRTNVGTVLESLASPQDTCFFFFQKFGERVTASAIFLFTRPLAVVVNKSPLAFIFIRAFDDLYQKRKRRSVIRVKRHGHTPLWNVVTMV